MAYYGSGGAPPPPQYSQGSAPPQGLGPMFAGPPGHGQHEMYGQPPDMYQGGGTPQGYNGYDGQMYSAYGGQEYYNQQAPMHGYPNHGEGGQGHPGMGQMEGGGLYPRPHINPSFLPPENPPAQEKPTRILRNPYPTVSKEELRNQQKDEIYDPSNPTLSAANSKSTANAGSRNGGSSSSSGHQRQTQLQNQNLQSSFHQQMQMGPSSQAPPPPQFHQSTSSMAPHSQAPPPPQFHQFTSSMASHSQAPPPSHFNQSGSSMAAHSQAPAPPHFNQSGSSMASHSQAPPPPRFNQSGSSMASHSQAPPPPQFNQSGSSMASHSQAPPPPQFHQSAPSAIPNSQHVAAVSLRMFDNMSASKYASQEQMSRIGNEPPRQEQTDPNGKMQVMTGLVTHVSPGAFGMISDEIFFQESCVSGPLPKVGDKVVVECEPVKGMPFKYNAKKVTKLDADLVRDDNAPNRSTPSTSNNNFERRYERPDFGPLPTMPESLNLPKAYAPPNLSSIIPSSSQSSQPLKSILKRNPPPPPVISKAGVFDNLKPASASSFKPGIFTADLDRDVPRKFGASSSGPPLDFPEYTYVRNKDPVGQPEPVRQTSPRITRLLPSSPTPIRERDYVRPQTFSPERERRKAASPLLKDIFERRDRSPTWRNKSKSRSKSPKRDTVTVRHRSSSPSRRKSRRSSSKSKSPRDRNRRSRRSRSKSSSPKRHKHPSPKSGRVARSPSPRSRRRSRSASLRSRRRSRSGSLRSRRRSRSTTPRSRRRVSKSPSRERDRRRSTSRSRRSHRSRRSSRSKSSSRRRRSSSSVRSTSPTPSSFRRGGTIVSETVTHGIVVKTGTSSLFPKVIDRGDSFLLSASGTTTTTSITTAKSAPMPIKFQIANPPKPQAILPNPSFKGMPVNAGQQSGNYVQNSVFNITKTVANPAAAQEITDMKGQKKKPREQEPAFRVIEVDPNTTEKPSNKVGNKTAADEKIKQWEAERQALKSKVTELTSENLLKNPVKIHQLKQTIQNDLHELRSKEKNADPGVKLLQNLKNIQQLKQTVERDLGQLRNKEKPSSEKTETTMKSQLNIQQLKSSVQQGLKDLRSKFDSQAPKVPSQSNASRPGPSSNPKPTGTTSSDNKPSAPEESGNGANIPTRTIRNSSERPNPKNMKKSTPLDTELETPPYDEEMERLQEEIHRQRFLEEERRLRAMGEQGALQQLYYMEDRRQRRLEERNLARIRMKEIQLKKDKKFGDLQKLREQYGPPAERLNHERQLRQARMEEEMQESQLHGQAEAIRRQELDYQKWLEDEAISRREAERASRGFEGRVKRRRTPSPPMHHNQGPPQRMQHDRSRRRSRSASYERYRDDYSRRSHRSRSREMEYDQFVAHGGMSMPHPYDGPPPGYGRGPPPPGHFEQEGFYISRAMDSVSRRQDELVQREMEIEQRMEMAGRRMGGPPPGYGHPSAPPHHPHRDDGEYGRFVVRRR